MPTSLLAQTTAASAVSGRSAAANSSGSTRPCSSTPIQETSKPSASIHRAASRTAACSTVETTAWRFSGGADRARPRTARLSASVPPPVKKISAGDPPSSAATGPRAASTASLAAFPAACNEDGFPRPPPRCGSMASSTLGSRSVVAALSR